MNPAWNRFKGQGDFIMRNFFETEKGWGKAERTTYMVQFCHGVCSEGRGGKSTWKYPLLSLGSPGCLGINAAVSFRTQWLEPSANCLLSDSPVSCLKWVKTYTFLQTQNGSVPPLCRMWLSTHPPGFYPIPRPPFEDGILFASLCPIQCQIYPFC